MVRKNLRQQKGRGGKKVQNNNSTFGPELSEPRKSSKPPERILRPRELKNYCELSKLSISSNSTKEKEKDKENCVNESNRKGLPIYRTVKLSEENLKNNEEIYEFPDDSQESAQKGKKRKKTAKKPAVKRAKRAISSRPVVSQKVQKKSIKKVSQTVRFKEPDIEPVDDQKTVVIDDIQPTITIPEHLQNAGDSTIGEASTIKIISDKKLDGSKRISLTATPPVPKTITSELKLFGPKNAITSQPTTQYSNMVNHSLIRKSMSPITKLVENFDTGSPWRSVDTFTRVKSVVQSTPQINRLRSAREKKLAAQIINLNKKSINSEDTICISSTMNGKSSKAEENSVVMSPIRSEVSPRKFGTVISNLSPAQSKTTPSVNNNKSPIQNSQPSSVQGVSQQTIFPENSQQSSAQIATSQAVFPEFPIDLEDMPAISAVDNKENTVPSPKKSPKKKFSSPSPFRFEKIRSSRRIAASNESRRLLLSEKKNEEFEPQPGPSHLEHPRTSVLRQSNLNNFLNLDEMPESTRISSVHGIFDDVHSTPIYGKKPRKLNEVPDIENAFGFDSDLSESLSVIKSTSTPIIATETDVKKSVKGKLFTNARVKSAVPSRISINNVKKDLVKTSLNKKESEEKEYDNEIDEHVGEKENNNNNKNENNKINKDVEIYNEPPSNEKAALDAVSFSDTFDIHSENADQTSKVLDEIPLFVDLEPVHFTRPPRRSYTKRKRAVCFDTSYNEEDEDKHDKPKPKKKKSKLSKEEEKRMKEWLKNINETFDEIEHYDLVVE